MNNLPFWLNNVIAFVCTGALVIIVILLFVIIEKLKKKK